MSFEYRIRSNSENREEVVLDIWRVKKEDQRSLSQPDWVLAHQVVVSLTHGGRKTKADVDAYNAALEEAREIAQEWIRNNSGSNKVD